MPSLADPLTADQLACVHAGMIKLSVVVLGPDTGKVIAYNPVVRVAALGRTPRQAVERLLGA